MSSSPASSESPISSPTSSLLVKALVICQILTAFMSNLLFLVPSVVYLMQSSANNEASQHPTWNLVLLPYRILFFLVLPAVECLLLMHGSISCALVCLIERLLSALFTCVDVAFFWTYYSTWYLYPGVILVALQVAVLALLFQYYRQMRMFD